MFKWKVEEMALMKEESVYYIGREKIYSCERTTSEEDKIAFIDSMQDGKLSYLLLLIEKFKKDSETMPKDSYGNVKTVSLKAWIKRNDTKYSRPIIDDWYHYGKFNILGCERYITNDVNSKYHYDTYDDLVDEIFHMQLKKCEIKEKTYFAEHDERSILTKQVLEKMEQYGTTFGIHIVYGTHGFFVSDGNENEREFTIEELKELSDKYSQIDELINRLTEENNIKY